MVQIGLYVGYTILVRVLRSPKTYSTYQEKNPPIRASLLVSRKFVSYLYGTNFTKNRRRRLWLRLAFVSPSPRARLSPPLSSRRALHS
eukprot:SAG11_NODE_7426_length_1146_cov_0.951289_2_plen_87_part_01